MRELIAYGTTGVTLVLVLSRPRIGRRWRIGPALAAASGMLVMLVTGSVNLGDLRGAADALWRPFLTITAIMLSTSVAQRLRILDTIAKRLAPRPGQSVQRVFGATFAFSAATSAVLNNDAAVLLLTPAIVDMIRRYYPNQPDLVVPFAFAVFAAAGVAPLAISNPMNLILSEYAGISFNEYAVWMSPIAMAGWITAYTVLCLVFRVPLRLTVGSVVGRERVTLSRPARQFLAVLALALAAYPTLSYAGGPVWAVAAGTAILGVGLCWTHGVVSPGPLARGVSWPTLVFLFCVFVIVIGLRNGGLVDRIATLYGSVPHASAQLGLIATTSAVGSAILNNHPMAILNALSIRALHPIPLPKVAHQQVLAALIGGDLGPRLLPIGSLAGLLWLDSLRRLGVEVSLRRFVKVGIVMTVPTLAVSVGLLLAGANLVPTITEARRVPLVDF